MKGEGVKRMIFFLLYMKCVERVICCFLQLYTYYEIIFRKGHYSRNLSESGFNLER